jgi:hypothetical protein
MSQKPSQQREQGGFRKDEVKNDEITEENLAKTQVSKIEGILAFKCLILDVLSIPIEKWTKEQVGEWLERKMKMSQLKNIFYQNGSLERRFFT